MGKQKVSVGVTSAAGYGVTVAAVVAAALDYIGGDHSQPTKTTLVLGIVAGVSFVTTQVGRYLQAHAQIKAGAGTLRDDQYDLIAQHVQDTIGEQLQPDCCDQAVDYQDGEKAEGDDEPERLTDDEAAEDPEMGDPLDASPESYIADPKDNKGGADHPERW